MPGSPRCPRWFPWRSCKSPCRRQQSHPGLGGACYRQRQYQPGDRVRARLEGSARACRSLVTTGDLLVLLLPDLVGGEKMGGGVLSGCFREGIDLESFHQSSGRGLREASWGLLRLGSGRGAASPMSWATWGPSPHLPRGQELESTGAQGHAGRRARPNFLHLNYAGPILPNPPALSATCFPHPRQPPASRQPFSLLGLGGGLSQRRKPARPWGHFPGWGDLLSTADQWS